MLSPDGSRWYYLDMGWEDIMLAVEYDGDHHRSDPAVSPMTSSDAEDLDELGWIDIRVVGSTPRRRRYTPAETRVGRADALTLR